jgi:hypothetical protein
VSRRGLAVALLGVGAGSAIIGLLSALGLPHGGPVTSWVPILMSTVLFGLSMDYEVFLLSRVLQGLGPYGRRPRQRRPRPGGDRPGDHQCRRDHGGRVHRIRGTSAGIGRGRRRPAAD